MSTKGKACDENLNTLKCNRIKKKGKSLSTFHINMTSFTNQKTIISRRLWLGNTHFITKKKVNTRNNAT